MSYIYLFNLNADKWSYLYDSNEPSSGELGILALSNLRLFLLTLLLLEVMSYLTCYYGYYNGFFNSFLISFFISYYIYYPSSV